MRTQLLKAYRLALGMAENAIERWTIPSTVEHDKASLLRLGQLVSLLSLPDGGRHLHEYERDVFLSACGSRLAGQSRQSMQVQINAALDAPVASLLGAAQVAAQAAVNVDDDDDDDDDNDDSTRSRERRKIAREMVGFSLRVVKTTDTAKVIPSSSSSSSSSPSTSSSSSSSSSAAAPLTTVVVEGFAPAGTPVAFVPGVAYRRGDVQEIATKYNLSAGSAALSPAKGVVMRRW